MKSHRQLHRRCLSPWTEELSTPLTSGFTVPAKLPPDDPLLLVGTQRTVGESFGVEPSPNGDDRCVAMALSPRGGSSSSLTSGFTRSAFVTGANFDARRYDGELELSEGDHWIKVRWLKSLREVAIDADWLAALT